MNVDFYFFFSGVRNPQDVSDVVTCLAAGKPLEVLRLSDDLLPPVVLLATIGLRAFDQQIVDDYVILLDRVEELFAAPCPGVWHPQLSLVSGIQWNGASGEFILDSLPEARYMFDLYESLVNAELGTLFGSAKKGKQSGKVRR